MLDRKSEPGKRRKADGSIRNRKLPSPKTEKHRSFLNVNPEAQFEIVRGSGVAGSRADTAVETASAAVRSTSTRSATH